MTGNDDVSAFDASLVARRAIGIDLPGVSSGSGDTGQISDAAPTPDAAPELRVTAEFVNAWGAPTARGVERESSTSSSEETQAAPTPRLKSIGQGEASRSETALEFLPVASDEMDVDSAEAIYDLILASESNWTDLADAAIETLAKNKS